MQQILDYLQQLGFSDIEAKLYLSLLESGPMSVKDLSESVDVKRTTAYFHIDTLIEKGLIIRVVRGTRKQVAAVQPENALHALVQQRLVNAECVKKELPTMLRDIDKTYAGLKSSDTFEVKHYKSISGIRSIYDDLFKSEDLCSYINLVGSGSLFTDNIGLLDEAFAKNPKLQLRELIDDSPISRYETGINLSRHKGRYFRKFMPSELKLTSEDTHIYDGKVAIVHFVGKVSGLVLKNSDYYNNAKAMFEYFWKTLPDTA